ncbi:MAG TPA: class I SAM-dependent methyltransferase [Xanthomonadaceae bacterium]|nr:class I SAM-dependent methyltransferase [Xanthomonadaceae bacterium]
MSLELHAPLLSETPAAGEPFVVSLPLTVHAPMVFAPDLQLVLEEAATGAVAWIGRLGEEVRIGWLPRGTYFVRWMTPVLALAAGSYRVRATAIGAHGERAQTALEFALGGGLEGGPLSGAWQVEAAEDSPSLEGLSWRRRGDDAFAQRFDAAPERIAGQLLEGAEQLRRRVLEIGCGDGSLALGLALRCRPQHLIAVDREDAWRDLPARMEAEHIPVDALPATLAFECIDGSGLPFADRSLDVAICWDRLEALEAGGSETLREIRRVLVPDGLVCLRTDTGTVGVTALEGALRALGFEPWRVGVRCRDVVEYTAASRDLPIPDLAIGELCTSWRKRPET